MHGQRLFPDSDCRQSPGLAAEVLAGVILDASQRIDSSQRQQARVLFIEKGIAGERLRDLTDADLETVFGDKDDLLRDLQHASLVAKDDIFQATLKEGMTGYA